MSKGKIVLITGGNRGLGRATALSPSNRPASSKNHHTDQSPTVGAY